MGRRLLKALGVLVLLFLALLLALPYFINLEQYRTLIAEEMSRRLGRPVQVSSLRLRVIPRVSLDIRGLRILDPPAFGGKPALTAESLRARVRIVPLLRKRLVIESVLLSRPVLVLRRNAGFNNLYGPGPSAPAPGAEPAPPAPAPPTEGPAAPPPLLAGLLIGNLNIQDARFRIEDADIGAPISIEGINLLLRQPSPEAPVEVRLRTRSPGLQVKAEIGPVDWTNPLAAPIEANLVIGKGWLRALGPWLRRRQANRPAELTAGELSGEIRFRGDLLRQGRIKGDLSLRRIEGRLGDRRVAEDPNLDLTFKSDVTLSRPDAASPAAFEMDGELGVGRLLFHVTARGTAGPGGTAFQVKIEGARVQGEDLAPLLQIASGGGTEGLTLAGLVGLSVKVRGEDRKTSASLTLDGRDVEVRYGQVFRKRKGVPLNLAATVAPTPKGVKIQPVSFELRQIRFQGDLLQEGGIIRLKGETNAFDLEGLASLFPQAGRWALAGTTRIGIVTGGSLEDILRRRLQIQLTLEDGAANIPGLPTRVRNVRGFLLITPRSIQVSRTRARIGASRVELEARLLDFDAPRIVFDLRLPVFRQKDFVLRRPPSTPKSTAQREAPPFRRAAWHPGRRPARAAAAPLRLSQKRPALPPTLLKRTRADGTLWIGRGQAGGVHFQNLAAGIRLQKGKLRARWLKADLYGGKLEGRGTYRLDLQPASFRSRLSVKGMRVEKALEGRPLGPFRMSGRVDLKADLAGAGLSPEALKRALSAKGEISIADGEIQGLGFLEQVERLTKMKGLFGLENGKKRFDRLAGPFEVRAGKVILPNLRMAASGLSLAVKGEVGLDLQSRLTVTAEFDEAASRRLSRGILGILVPPGERFRIPFRIQGPLTSPRVSLDPRFFGKSLEERIQREPGKLLRDTLERLLR